MERTQMEGAYKGYKSAECIMSGLHDFTCYLKRGWTLHGKQQMEKWLINKARRV